VEEAVEKEKNNDDDDDDNNDSEDRELSQSASGLRDIARLFPWHGRQRQAAERLWQLVSSDTTSGSSSSSSSASTAAKQRKYILRLSEALICQQVYH
jgi:hypothetical protein